MNDIETLKTYLSKHSPWRDEVKNKPASDERIQPQYSEEWPVRLNSSVPNLLVNSEITMLHRQQADDISKRRC